jgi:uncharacterized membrane protein YqgA involved in biofilm formation
MQKKVQSLKWLTVVAIWGFLAFFAHAMYGSMPNDYIAIIVGIGGFLVAPAVAKWVVAGADCGHQASTHQGN